MRKGYVPAIAAALLVIVVFILVATAFPAVKETTKELAGAVVGK